MTHGHVDHAGGISQFDRVYVNKGDKEMANGITLKDREEYISRMNRVKATAVMPGDNCSETQDRDQTGISSGKEWRRFHLGGRELEVTECPGHTTGSICLTDKADRIVFTGDSMNDWN